jgi:hypothetical protein
MPSFHRHDARALAVLAATAMEDPDARVDRAALGSAVSALSAGADSGEPEVTVDLTPAERRALRFCWDTLADGDAAISDDAFERVRAALA